MREHLLRFAPDRENQRRPIHVDDPSREYQSRGEFRFLRRAIGERIRRRMRMKRKNIPK